MRGFKDNIQPESYIIEQVRACFEKISKTYGYDIVHLPVVEEAQLYFRTSGNDSDICNKELFEVRRYKDEFRNWVLRPEGTASFMRAIQESGLIHNNKIIKGSYFAPMFRYNRPQKGRYRQFLHAGFEYVGSNSIFSDLEIIKCATTFLNELGIKFVLEINSIGNAQDRQIYREELKKIFNIQAGDPLKILDKATEFINIPHMQINEIDSNNFKTLLSLLEKEKIEYVHNPYLVRGLDYYNALVFELKFNGQTVLAGGRYDGLMSQISKYSVPAIGFAAGVERLAEAMNFEYINKKIAIIPIDVSEYGVRVLNTITEQYSSGCVVLWEMNLKQAIKYAFNAKYEYIILCGKDEEISNKIIIMGVKHPFQKIIELSNNFIEELEIFALELNKFNLD